MVCFLLSPFVLIQCGAVDRSRCCSFVLPNLGLHFNHVVFCIGTRIWKYDPDEFEEDECGEGEEGTGHGHHEHESHGHGEHGHEGHGEHEDDEQETEMFYHLITFK